MKPSINLYLGGMVFTNLILNKVNGANNINDKKKNIAASCIEIWVSSNAKNE
ncbi:hypothetical protein NBRC116600_04340 [Thalassotalea sp. SU-HH00458]